MVIAEHRVHRAAPVDTQVEVGLAGSRGGLVIAGTLARPTPGVVVIQDTLGQVAIPGSPAQAGTPAFQARVATAGSQP